MLKKQLVVNEVTYAEWEAWTSYIKKLDQFKVYCFQTIICKVFPANDIYVVLIVQLALALSLVNRSLGSIWIDHPANLC